MSKPVSASLIQAATVPARRSSFRWRRLVFSGMIGAMLLLIVFHRTLLELAAEPLVVSSPVAPQDDILLWKNADKQFDVAADLIKNDSHGARKIVLLPSPPDRLQRLGILPREEDLCRTELSKRQVPFSLLEILSTDQPAPADAYSRLRAWFEKNPDATLSLLCDEFRSGQAGLQLRRRLGELADRIRVHSLPDRRYNKANWWKTRIGARAFAFAWIGRIDGWIRGTSEIAPEINSWDPDEFERQLREPDTPTPDKARPVREKSKGWLPVLAYWLDIGTPASPVDYVLLLPGDQSTRPFAAAAIVRAGLARAILVPKNFASPQELDGITFATHEVIQQILKLQGINEDQVIFLPGQSDSTMDDAKVARTFLNENPNSKIAIVTNFYHTRRTRLVFESLYPDSKGRFSFVSVPTEKYGPENWWKSEEGTFQIASEYLKLGYYWIRYGYGGFLVCACCTVFGGLILWRYLRNNRLRRKNGANRATAVLEQFWKLLGKSGRLALRICAFTEKS